MPNSPMKTAPAKFSEAGQKGSKRSHENVTRDPNAARRAHRCAQKVPRSRLKLSHPQPRLRRWPSSQQQKAKGQAFSYLVVCLRRTFIWTEPVSLVREASHSGTSHHFL